MIRSRILPYKAPQIVPPQQGEPKSLRFSLTILPLLIYLFAFYFLEPNTVNTPLNVLWRIEEDFPHFSFTAKDVIVFFAVLVVFLDLLPAFISQRSSAVRIISKIFSLILHVVFLFFPGFPVDACLVNLTLLTSLTVLISTYLNLLLSYREGLMVLESPS